jgi:hypothetical protein
MFIISHVRTLAVVALLLVMVSLVGCQSSGAKPGTFTEADVAKLKWIEGTWRGTGEKQPPFFERYHFEGSTMVVEGLADETGEKVNETSRFELKDGRFGQASGDSESAASAITDTYVQFIPVKGSKNSFRFEKQTADTWQATIEWPADGNKPARTIVYKMERVKGKQERVQAATKKAASAAFFLSRSFHRNRNRRLWLGRIGWRV